MDNQQNMSKEEQIGFHKGSLSTLAKERAELSKMVGVVEQLMQMHVQALTQLGVNLEALSQNQQTSQNGQMNNQKPIEDLLNRPQ
jgi:thiaminase